MFFNHLLPTLPYFKITQFLILPVHQELTEAFLKFSSFSFLSLGIMAVLSGPAGNDTLELLHLKPNNKPVTSACCTRLNFFLVKRKRERGIPHLSRFSSSSAKS